MSRPYFHVSDQRYLYETEYDVEVDCLDYDEDDVLDEEPDYDDIANRYERGIYG